MVVIIGYNSVNYGNDRVLSMLTTILIIIS